MKTFKIAFRDPKVREENGPLRLRVGRIQEIKEKFCPKYNYHSEEDNVGIVISTVNQDDDTGIPHHFKAPEEILDNEEELAKFVLKNFDLFVAWDVIFVSEEEYEILAINRLVDIYEEKKFYMNELPTLEKEFIAKIAQAQKLRGSNVR
ncbi:hypothetical protein BKH42_08610 [Helicobacter sp. 13S00482-2]|uniref:hypothetical protein n=1 Tax=Helicobacter sp. 13S00482-2 TaxID=1476200 RepID=UPI000BA78998|nr:hypothetical protein [Helicobacter sp. 13S00482-2]PAF52944.1 hypothetical protein BKH42_08610 [Helicobacter sp. 13S00482-2]